MRPWISISGWSAARCTFGCPLLSRHNHHQCTVNVAPRTTRRPASRRPVHQRPVPQPSSRSRGMLWRTTAILPSPAAADFFVVDIPIRFRERLVDGMNETANHPNGDAHYALAPRTAPEAHHNMLPVGLASLYMLCRRAYPDQLNPLQATTVIKYWWAMICVPGYFFFFSNPE